MQVQCWLTVLSAETRPNAKPETVTLLMTCSVCSTTMEARYCPTCGQQFKAQRVTFGTVLHDLFDSVFSLDRSLVKNMQVAITRPQELPTNYWKGFRRYYFSPGKFFGLASLFLVLHYAFAHEFLGIAVTSNIASQFVIVFTNVVLLTLTSLLVYVRYRKNLFEHLILNVYNVSVWVILFVPVSLLVSLAVDNNTTEQLFFIAFHLVVIVWNSLAFPLTTVQRAGAVAVHMALLYGALYLLVATFGEF